MSEPSPRVGSDTGGTFTDLVAADGTVVKVPSTPDDPGRAVRAGVDRLGGAAVLTHGTTVATNALLERRGARVALVTNEGFADVIEIARQDRPSLYDQSIDRPTPLVPRAWRYEVRGRLDATGAELVPVDLATLPAIGDGVEAVDVVAVCLLHSDLSPTHERAVRDELVRRGLDATISSDVAPEFREYERLVTTVIDAYVRPACRTYVHDLASAAEQVFVMTSAGGLVPAADAADRAVALLLSGPAGGVRAGAAVALANGYPDAITFDMGGTSTDVCLVLDGRPAPAAEREVAGFPVRRPSLDVLTIGAGGGSIARIDLGGALVVGPESAGAVPGPACYGHGGTAPTVTDANLVAGRLGADVVLPGLGRLDVDAARTALAAAEVTAEGVLSVVDATMAAALRTVSIERGVDPRGLALVAFGGAGPLHACALADLLEIPTVLVPARAGVLSAVGILTAPVQLDLVASWPAPLDHAGAHEAVVALGERAAPTVAAQVGARPDDVDVELALDCRYQGQSHELRVPSVDAFGAEHARRNGYERPSTPVEVVALRASASMPAPIAMEDLPDIVRAGAIGPAVIDEPDCTIWVAPGWRATPGLAGALVLTRTP